ncbi:MAG: MATE family efflux transporter [Lachnospiraceae bacterium]
MNKNTIGKQFFKYVSLNIMGMIGLSLYILADTFFIARGIGSDGLTALNLAIPMYGFMYGVGMMVGMGGATRFSIVKGQSGEQKEGVGNRIFTIAFTYVAITSLFFVVLSGFSGPLSSLLGADSVTYEMTRVYLKVILAFAPMFMLNHLFVCFVRNDGNPQLAMAGMLAGTLFNIVLDYVFIYPCNMGMGGAALATGGSPIISMLILSIHFFKKKNTFHFTRVKPKLKEIWDISILGIPSLITEMSNAVVILIFNFLILKLAGNLGVAAYGVVANIALVVISIFTGIAQGVQPLLSENYGRGNKKDVGKAFRYALLTALVFAIGVYLFTFFQAEFLSGLFNKDGNKELTRIAAKGLRIYFVSFFFAGANIISATYFSSIDTPKNGFIISILRGIVIILPMAFLLSNLMGITGVWLSIPVTEALVLMTAVFLMRKGTNRKSV